MPARSPAREALSRNHLRERARARTDPRRVAHAPQGATLARAAQGQNASDRSQGDRPRASTLPVQSLVTVWGAPPLLVQVTMPPGLTVAGVGVNAKSVMLMAKLVFGDEASTVRVARIVVWISQ